MSDSRELSVWTTEYYHIMQDHSAIIDFIKSTGMRPYLNRIPGALQGEYTADVLEKIKDCYQSLENGTVLFAFKRFFFIAVK
jgi:trans-aconitate 2-methyltransferase